MKFLCKKISLTLWIAANKKLQNYTSTAEAMVVVAAAAAAVSNAADIT